MDLPIPSHRDPRRRSDDDFERLRRSLTHDLDRWPHFADDVISAVRDVVPLTDVEETDDTWVLDVELPGVRRGDVTLEVLDHRLVVTAQRRERRRAGLLRHRSRTAGRFRLVVTLPPHVDRDGVTASLDHGVLTVVVPKTARGRRRRIPIGPARPAPSA